MDSQCPPPPLQISGRVLLIGWDAADWKVISPLLDRGEMPHLQGLIARGAMGDLLTLRPVLSPMLWNSIATGHRPERHGVLGFAEVDPATNAVRPVCSTSRKCKALWNIVTQAGGRAHVVNWYASHPAEPIHGVCVSDALVHQRDAAELPPGTVHPAALDAEIADLVMRPDEIDAATLRLFVPRLEEVDQDRDRRLATLAKLLAESFTVHNIATRLLAEEPWDLAALYYPGIDHFSHGFMSFHPPQMPGVSDEQFRLYSEVIAGAYRLHDLFLGRLLALAGPDTSVVLLSDHGFHSDHLRPLAVPQMDPVGPAYQHRDHGILVLAGAGIRHDERIYGAGLLDIAPTVLTMLGLPVGKDMPGRVLSEAFADAPHIEAIPSWENLPGNDGRHAPDRFAPSSDDSLALEQFAALGYLDAEEMQGALGPEACRRENEWNLAQSLLDAGRYEDAVDRLLVLCERWPERADFAVTLAQALRRLLHSREARELIEALVAPAPSTRPALFLRGMAFLEDGNFGEGLRLLEEVEAEYGGRADFHQRKAMGLLKTGLLEGAQSAFARAVEIDPHDFVGWMGLARCALRLRNWQLAECNALEGIRLDFNRPIAHAILGAARLRMGRREEADLSLRVASHQAPGWAYPLRLRARLWNEPSPTAETIHQQLGAALRHQQHLRARLRAFMTPARREMLQRLNERYRTFAPERRAVRTAAPLDLVIVSGLPRSGTSLLMQMIVAGGLPALTDHQRQADADNPKGYLEWEPIRNLPSRPELLHEADGKAVKIVSPLLVHLPRKHQYRIVFVDRPIGEVIASQLKMRSNRGEKAPPHPERLAEVLERHRRDTLALLERTENVELLVVPFPQLIASPAEWSGKIAEFLGERALDREAMAAAVQAGLYRNRCP